MAMFCCRKPGRSASSAASTPAALLLLLSVSVRVATISGANKRLLLLLPLLLLLRPLAADVDRSTTLGDQKAQAHGTRPSRARRSDMGCAADGPPGIWLFDREKHQGLQRWRSTVSPDRG